MKFLVKTTKHLNLLGICTYSMNVFLLIIPNVNM